MSKGGSSGSIRTPAVAAETPAVPAVARDVSKTTEEAQSDASEKRARLRGVRSTYARFASDKANGTASKLG